MSERARLVEVSPSGTVSYRCDADGRRATMTVAGQLAVTYVYDNAHRLTSITQDTTTIGMTYDDANRRSTLTLANGIVATYGYDNASHLTSLAYTLNGSPVGDLTYTYDAVGRRTSVGGSFARTGLPQALGSATVDAGNQLVALGGATLSYDLNGNLANDGTTSYTWNARNELVGLNGGVNASFQYDALGRRRGKTVGGTTTNFLHDGLTLVQELAGGGTPIANLLTGLGLDEAFARTDGSGTNTLLADALGSTLALANGAGTVQTQYTFEPFGATTLSGATSTSTAQFTGRDNDGTGLYYYRARFYHPGLQRFISEDPLGFGAGLNAFAYAGNAPTMFGDPLGLKPCSNFGGGRGRGPGCPGGQGSGGGRGAGGSGAGAGDSAGDGADRAHKEHCDGWYKGPGDPAYTLGRVGSDIIAPGDPFGRFLENSFPASHAASTIHDNLVGGLTAEGWPDWAANYLTMPGTYVSEVINQVGRNLGHPVFGPTCHP